MKFSVILPVYKTEKKILKRAIDSVIAQTYGDWELTVVDDNKKESDYKEITKQFSEENADDRIHFVIQEDNHGANVARNIGVNNSNGDWCTFIDADDEWKPEYLEKCLKAIRENPSVSLVSSGYIIITRGRRVTIARNLPSGNYYEEELEEDLVSPTSAVAVKREVLQSIAGFDESLPARQDYDTWLRVSEQYDFAFNPEASVLVYRNGHDSISTNYMNHVNGTLMVLDKILKKVTDENKVRRIKDAQYMHIAEYCIQYEDYKLAKIYAEKCSDSKRKRKVMRICRYPKIYSNIKNLIRSVVRKLH